MKTDLVVTGSLNASDIAALFRLAQPYTAARGADRLFMSDVNHAPDVRARVASYCTSVKADCAFIPAGKSLADFKMIVFDMDSTLINVECIDEVAAVAGRKAEVAAITEAAMQNARIDYATSLLSRTAKLAGVEEAALHEVFVERVRLSPGVERLIRAAQSQGLRTGIISGGFTFFANRLRAQLNMDFAFANELEITSHLVTGRVVGQIIDGPGKALLLKNELRQCGFSANDAIVVGDGANDIPMMAEVPFSVAFHGKEVVRKFAEHQINFGPMDTILQWLPTPTSSDTD